MEVKINLLSLRARIQQNLKSDFVTWQTDLHKEMASFPGFVSLEILSPSQQEAFWKFVLRFYDANALIKWKNSEKWAQLRARLEHLAIDHDIIEELSAESNTQNGVTEVFITQVPANKSEIYREWTAKIHQIEVQFEGFKGVYVQSPSQEAGGNWITLLQFDTPEHLDRWLSSPQRKQLLEESTPLIGNLESHRVISPYANWFSGISKNHQLPAAWKQTMVILLVLFPIVMLQFKFLLKLTSGWDIALGTFFCNAMSVTLISWPLMPIAIRLLRWWLLPQELYRDIINVIGIVLMLLLYAAEIWIFWSFV